MKDITISQVSLKILGIKIFLRIYCPIFHLYYCWMCNRWFRTCWFVHITMLWWE